MAYVVFVVSMVLEVRFVVCVLDLIYGIHCVLVVDGLRHVHRSIIHVVLTVMVG